jgi:hypothetical protein
MKNITNYMEKSPSWEAASRSATQEFPDILWNPKIHFRIHMNPSLFSALSQTNPVHTSLHIIYLRSISILSSHICKYNESKPVEFGGHSADLTNSIVVSSGSYKNM